MNKMRWFFWTLLMLNAVAAYWFSSEADHRRDVVSNLTSVNRAGQGAEVKELQLWGESPAADEQKVVAEEASQQQVEKLSPSEPERQVLDMPVDEEVCRQLGPFDPQTVARILLVLGDRANGILVINKEEVISEGFWLIMQPRETRAEAELLLKSLHDRNIESYLITDGEYENGITLGVFSGKENADSYQDKLSAEGVESVLIPRTKVEKKAWVQLKGDNNDENTLSDIAATLGIQQSAIRQEEATPCEMSN